MKKSVVIACAIVLVFGVVGSARADTYAEVDDAGEFLSDAQEVGVGVFSISGSFLSSSDADLYKLYLT